MVVLYGRRSRQNIRYLNIPATILDNVKNVTEEVQNTVCNTGSKVQEALAAPAGSTLLIAIRTRCIEL